MAVGERTADHFGPGRLSARMLFDGRRVSPVGAAMAGAATIDSFDGHDGHVLTKGHAGAAVLPGLLAFADVGRVYLSGEDSNKWHEGYGGGLWFAWLDRAKSSDAAAAPRVVH